MKTLEQRFLEKVRKSEKGCWNWDAAVDRNGYGKISVGHSMKFAHRVAYELYVGKLPPATPRTKILHHVCLNKRCVNPNHLELISHSENIKLGRSRPLHCKSGHVLTGRNLYMYKGGRYCKTCKNLSRVRSMIRALS